MASVCQLLLTLCAVIIQVHFGMAEYPPRLVEEPMDLVVGRHQPATLECRAEGDPPPVMRWYKDGVALTLGGAGGSRRVLLPDGELFFLRATHARRDTDQGVYWCEATNRLGTVRSRNATLQVAILREDFRLAPADTRGAAGDSALLECSPPRGTPEPTVIWRKNGQDLDLEDNDRISIVDGGNLVIQDLRTTDDGRYQCVAKNTAGIRESAIARLRVYIKPYLIAGPEDVTVLTGKTVTFECRVGGDPLPDVLWRRTADGGNMPLGRVHILEDRSLQLDSVTIEDQGDYICEADNTVGTIKAWGTLTVHSLPTLDIKTTIQTVEEGGDAHFECNVKGTPKPSMFWSTEGNYSLIFPGNTWERYSASSVKDGESRLLLKNVTKADSNTVIICTAVNLAGSIVGRARLIVTSEDSRPPPVIIVGPSNQTLPVKTLAIMPCSAEGDPTPIISWYFKSSPIVPNKKYEISESGTMTIKELTFEDSGLYTCVASSKNGKSVWSGNLSVDSPTNPNINFFRGPDMSTLPGAPTRPQIRNQTDASVTITWSQNNKIGSSSLLGYQVEMFGRDNMGGAGKIESKWVVVARRLNENFFTQKLLVPGGTYVFVVRAENAHGLSPPSSLSETVVIEGDDSNYVSKNIDDLGLSPKVRAIFKSEDIVQLLDTIAVESTAVKLVWKASNTVNLDGFNIYFRPLDGFNLSSTDYKMVSLLNSRGTTSYEISGLLKFTQYEFFLIPFYRKLEGKPSNSRLVRTLEDIPEAAPTDLEGAYINATSILLKWKPPPPGTHHGVIQCYQIVIKEAGNDSHVVQNMSVVGNSIRINNLSPGVTYWIQLAAATMRGIGPFSHHGTLHLPASHGFDPSTRLLNHPHNKNNLHHDIQTVVSGDLLSETWFLALLGLILTIMTLLFVAMIVIRRRHLMMKENPLPNLYDSRNGSKNFVSHMSIKSAMGVPHPISTGFKQNGNIKTDSLLWVKNRPDTWRRGDKDQEFGQMTLPEYDKINGNNMPDYAEVDASMITFRKGSETPNSPAAYASVTLVPSPGNIKGSMEWTSRYGSSNSTNKNEDHDEEIYPASNGGYFNRNLMSETYLSYQNQNISKYHNGVRNNDKSNLSLHSENYITSAKVNNTNNKDQTFTLPQNHFGTGRRNQRPMKLSKFDNGSIIDNDSYQSSNMRMQENPTFGLTDGMGYSPDCEQINCHSNVPPMMVMNHQYPRPANNMRTSPNDARPFASFKNKNRDTEYHTSTRSEPGNNL